MGFFSIFFKKFKCSGPRNTRIPAHKNHIPAPSNAKKYFRAIVLLLDDEQVSIDIPSKALGVYLQNKLNSWLEIDPAEASYFGLAYLDHQGIKNWLDPSKKVKKQIGKTGTIILNFRVRFYPSEPSNLKCDYTRYQVFLQVKQDLQSSLRLGNSTLTVCAELAALSLQSEFGDFINNEETCKNIQELRFIPEERYDNDPEVQDMNFDYAIFEYYRDNCKGRTPERAEKEYLSKAKWLDMYGVDLYEVTSNKDKKNYHFGITPEGICVYDSNMEKIGRFVWQNIKRLDFNRKKFYIDCAETLNSNDPLNPKEIIHKFIFFRESPRHTKTMWKSAISHHQFYRLDHAAKKAKEEKLIRTASGFIYHGKTQAQIHNIGGGGCSFGTVARMSSKNSTFTRRPSKRFSAKNRTFNVGKGTTRNEYLESINLIQKPLNVSYFWDFYYFADHLVDYSNRIYI